MFKNCPDGSEIPSPLGLGAHLSLPVGSFSVSFLGNQKLLSVHGLLSLPFWLEKKKDNHLLFTRHPLHAHTKPPHPTYHHALIKTRVTWNPHSTQFCFLESMLATITKSLYSQDRKWRDLTEVHKMLIYSGASWLMLDNQGYKDPSVTEKGRCYFSFLKEQGDGALGDQVDQRLWESVEQWRLRLCKGNTAEQRCSLRRRHRSRMPWLLSACHLMMVGVLDSWPCPEGKRQRNWIQTNQEAASWGKEQGET